MFELVDTYSESAVIKVIGVGGGGGNAVMHMAHSNIDGVEFICANTDSQALKNTDVRTVLQLGNDITQGLGAGANPVVGREAALETRTVSAKPSRAPTCCSLRLVWEVEPAPVQPPWLQKSQRSWVF